MRFTISLFYLIILQILWIFRTFYEAILPEKKKLTPEKNFIHNAKPFKQLENERRHLIQLITSKPNQQNGRPVCYMNVCQILTPNEQEMLRCVCAKGAESRNILPAGTISRAAFTNAWMESFSLVL